MDQIPFSGPAKRLTDHRFLNLFTTEMRTKDGLHPWIFASRKKKPMSGPLQPDAVVLIVVVASADEPRLVVTREFRAPLGRYEVAFPAGLIDQGETPAVAAARELFEETGLTLTNVVHVSPPVSSSAGMTDESACLVYGEGTGTISKAHLEEHEDIETRLMTLAEIRILIQNPQVDIFSVRFYTTLIGFITAGKIALPPATLSLTTLYRPVGPKELELIKESGYRSFPPRLPEQPIFYPVLNEEYAVQIARDWNVRQSGAGFVTRFQARSEFLAKYPPKTVGAKVHSEIWVPAEDLAEFNRNIVGLIEVTATFGGDRPTAS